MTCDFVSLDRQSTRMFNGSGKSVLCANSRFAGWPRYIFVLAVREGICV